MDAGEAVLSHMGQYPIIYLTFKDAKRQDYETSYQMIADVIADEFKRHDFLLDNLKLEEERTMYQEIMTEKAAERDYAKSILFLSKCLETYYGKKAVVIIDEYDVPLENSFTCGFYKEMINFIRALFESSLKDNTSIEFAAITGCLRISKESIFTGLNNLSIVSIRSTNFDEYFGFKVNEVEQMCHYYDMDDKYETVKDWYNGYTFGQTDIYNPWSVITYMNDARPNKDWLPMPYWAKGRSDLLIKPIRRSREAFVVEFKVAKDIDDMDQKADEAIQQIEDKNYDMDLKNDGYKYVSYYGIAFCGKECIVHCKPYEG